MNSTLRDIVLIIIAEEGGRIHGKTLIQKKAYFIGLMAGWLYAFYPNLFEHHTRLEPQWLLALAAITFLPIGYVISIFMISSLKTSRMKNCFRC